MAIINDKTKEEGVERGRDPVERWLALGRGEEGGR